MDRLTLRQSVPFAFPQSRPAITANRDRAKTPKSLVFFPRLHNLVNDVTDHKDSGKYQAKVTCADPCDKVLDGWYNVVALQEREQASKEGNDVGQYIATPNDANAVLEVFAQYTPKANAARDGSSDEGDDLRCHVLWYANQ